MPHVYAEEMLLTGVLMDFLALSVPKRLMRVGASFGRTLLTASLASVMGTSVALIRLDGALLIAAKAAISLFMARMMTPKMAYRDTVTFAILLFLAAFVSGGVALAIPGFATVMSGALVVTAGGGAALWAFIALLLALLFALTLSERARSASNSVTVSVRAGGEAVKMRGFIDSGNMLEDPLTGRCVALVSSSKFNDLMAGETARIAIPFTSAGGDGSLAAYPATIDVGGRAVEALIAEYSGSTAGYDIILPGAFKYIQR